jgi:hypothetical protein
MGDSRGHPEAGNGMGKKANERNVAELELQKENAEALTGIGQPENPTWRAL